ncbi:Probable serine/threonine-protein kinase abkC [Durusdinium trenchii]|uniref:Probable serine/threonine-protein kinase abkC n=1 Tax=Durusdinium trenchii TaxID=1381693 RepID=A0ABP0HAE1_9DINO
MCFATCSSCVTLFVLSLSSPTRCDVSGDVTGRRLNGPLRLFGLALGSGAAGVGLSYWRRPSEEIELPAVPEPEAFIHPYETWPWYQKAWFAFKRSVFLAFVFAPFMCASLVLLVKKENGNAGYWREFWLQQMLECTQRAGAAFQKFGQWLSMRPDMFPPDVILVLSKLRADAPAHPGTVSRQKLREHLGKEVEELFEEFEEEPVASGSVGQVHRARLRPEHALDGPGGHLREVAVKIQHPGVIESAFMDLNIVWKIVEFSENFLHMTMPFDRSDFDGVIQAQMDFTREAFNLQQFAKNFKGESCIRFPKVSSRFVTPEVLVETWESGELISNIMEDFDNAKAKCQDAVSALEEKKRQVQGKLSKILYDMSMKMMVRDNFVHGDLHGGNILYSMSDDHVTVLDAGIATSLEKRTFAPFGVFLHALCSGQTDIVVDYLQRFNESKICVNTKQLKTDIQETMDKYMGPFRLNQHGPLNAADMFGEVMFTLQRHGMLLKGDVASTLFTISISEGLVRQLDPTFDVAKQALLRAIVHYHKSRRNPLGPW